MDLLGAKVSGKEGIASAKESPKTEEEVEAAWKVPEKDASEGLGAFAQYCGEKTVKKEAVVEEGLPCKQKFDSQMIEIGNSSVGIGTNIVSVGEGDEIAAPKLQNLPDVDWGIVRIDWRDKYDDKNETVFSTGRSASAARPGQLTIFYSGTVNVYEGVAPEKAQGIMLIAAAAAANTNNPKKVNEGDVASPVLTRSPSLQSTSAAASPQPQVLPSTNNPISKLQAELPIARRHSLQRFLEKRRDRLVNKAPYAVTKTTDMKGSPESGCFSETGKAQEEVPPPVAANLA